MHPDPDPSPPTAAARPHALRHGDDERVDPWFWLRERDDPEVLGGVEGVGPTIAAALTARNPGLPVLFMSGYPRDRESEISGAAAAGAVLAKPFDARQLAEAVRRALDRRAPRPDGSASHAKSGAGQSGSERG